MITATVLTRTGIDSCGVWFQCYMHLHLRATHQESTFPLFPDSSHLFLFAFASFLVAAAYAIKLLRHLCARCPAVSTGIAFRASTGRFTGATARKDILTLRATGRRIVANTSQHRVPVHARARSRAIAQALRTRNRTSATVLSRAPVPNEQHSPLRQGILHAG